MLTITVNSHFDTVNGVHVTVNDYFVTANGGNLTVNGHFLNVKANVTAVGN